MTHEPEADPAQFTFGFGRRVCPGRVVAENSLFLNIAQTLAVYTMAKPVQNGKEIEPDMGLQPGVINHPKHFEISITPRSAHHETLIRSLVDRYPWQESDSKFLERLDT